MNEGEYRARRTHKYGGHGKGSGIKGSLNEGGGTGRYRRTSITVVLTWDEKAEIIEALAKTGETIGDVGRRLFAGYAASTRDQTTGDQTQP